MSEDNIQSQENEESQDNNDSEDSEIESEFVFPILEKEKRSLANELDIKREDTRSKLATILITILAVTYIAAFITMLIVIFVPIDQGEEIAERYTYSKDILSLLITTQIGLIGAVLGFYLGSSRNNQTKDY